MAVELKVALGPVVDNRTSVVGMIVVKLVVVV